MLPASSSATGRASASTQLAEYERYCREHGLAIQDLVDCSQRRQAAQAERGQRLVSAACRLPGTHWAVAVEHVPADWLQQ